MYRLEETMEDKPRFRLMKNGYDRFAVDDLVDRLLDELISSQTKLDTYRKQVEQLNEQLVLLRDKHQRLLEDLAVKEKAADDISRIALREASQIIDAAQHNADAIVKEALITARSVLIEIARISDDVKDARIDMIEKLAELRQGLDLFSLPETPNIEWLKDLE